MPGGFNILSVKAHLSKTWGPDSQRADTMLLIATTMEPTKRLGSDAEGEAWLDTAAQVYARRVGTSLSTGGRGKTLSICSRTFSLATLLPSVARSVRAAS